MSVLSLSIRPATLQDAEALAELVNLAGEGCCMGYRQVAERPMVKESWSSPGSPWVLLTNKL